MSEAGQSVASRLSAAGVYRKKPTIALLDLGNHYIASPANESRALGRACTMLVRSRPKLHINT